MQTPRTGCGTPGCTDPDCSIEAGYCHCECGQQTQVAAKTSSRYRTVRGQSLRFVHGHNAAAGPPGGKRGLLPAREIVRRFGEHGISLHVPDLIAAAHEKRLPCAAMVQRGQRTYCYFDEQQLAMWFDEHVCAFDGCNRHTLGGPSGYCSSHALEAERAKRKEEKGAERDWKTQEEAARYKGCGIGAVQAGRRRGELDPVRDGGRLRYQRAELDNWTPLAPGGQVRLEERECAYRECRQRFKPQHVGHEFHTRACGWAEREARDRDEIDAAKIVFDLLEAQEIGDELGLSRREILALRKRGPPRAVHWIGGGGLGVLLFPRSEIGRYRRDCAHRAKLDRRQMVWLEPKSVSERRYLVERVMANTGLREAQARAVVQEQVKSRRGQTLRFNAGRKRMGKADRWFNLFNTIRTELSAERQRSIELDLADDGPVSDYSVAVAVAELDCEQHPDDWLDHRTWDADGSIWTLSADKKTRKGAANRVLTAIKRLQIGYTKSQAA